MVEFFEKRDIRQDVDFANQQVKAAEKLLSFRISSQHVLDIVNKLPTVEEERSVDEISCDSAEASDLYALAGDMNDLLSKQIKTPSLVSKKRKRGAISWNDIDDTYDALRPHWESVVNKWHARSNFGSEKAKSSLKVFNQTIFTQISSALADEDRVLEKSRILFAESPRMEKTQSDSQKYDEEVYDDRQFYSMLLKTYLANASSGENMHERDLIELRKYKKQNTNVDRKASKGRKIRYVPHAKLKNFMFPIPSECNSTIDRERLLASLFQ